MESFAGPVVYAWSVEKPHLRYGNEYDGTKGTDYHSLVRIFPAVVFTQYVSDEESAGK